MKEMNVTEAQLRSWQPRPPAAKLKPRIFSTDPRVATASWLWGGLAPAMACVLLTLVILSRNGEGLGSKPMMALILSNQSCAAYAAGGAQIAQNHLATVTFDSTNRSSFRSIIGFTPTTNFIN
jgi:hypothetical protein